MAIRVSAVICVLLAQLSFVSLAAAQPVQSGTERLDSTRPEAWAVKYYTSTTLLTGFTVPERLEPGSLIVGGELVWVPFLTTEQQRVGFRGTKIEDLNKAPLYARPRVTVGLGSDVAATVAFVPPIETFGVTPKLLAVALERPIYSSEAWTLGWRAYGQVGTARSSYTCPQEALAFAPGSLQNPSGCLATSSDVATLRYVGVEMGVGDTKAGRRVTPHAAVAVNYLRNRFEVNSRRFGMFNGVPMEFIDRTAQESRGMTVSATMGVGVRLSDRLEAAVDVFYTPLWVTRAAGSPRQNDGLLNAKALLRYRIRRSTLNGRVRWSS